MADCKESVPEGRDPYKTIIVVKLNGKEIARKNAMHPMCAEYLRELTDDAISRSGGGTVELEYEDDPCGGLLFNL